MTVKVGTFVAAPFVPTIMTVKVGKLVAALFLLKYNFIILIKQ